MLIICQIDWRDVEVAFELQCLRNCTLYSSDYYIYNGCLALYNVMLTPRIYSTVKFTWLKLRPTKYTTVYLCDGAISVLNHCLSWF